MYRKLALACVALSAFARVSAAAIPGFEDPKVLEKVMKGEIVTEEVTQTKKDFRTVFRLYVPKADTVAWTNVVTDHAKYPSMISQVKSAETTKVNAEKTEYEYKMELLVKVGPFSQKIYPEGRQNVTPAKDAVSEAVVVNTITNYQDMIAKNSETTRLIPYEGGILVHDDINFTLVKENGQSKLIAKELNKNAKSMLEAFRAALTK